MCFIKSSYTDSYIYLMVDKIHLYQPHKGFSLAICISRIVFFYLNTMYYQTAFGVCAATVKT